MALLLATTSLPPFLRMRDRNPCLRLRTMVEGWKVRLVAQSRVGEGELEAGGSEISVVVSVVVVGSVVGEGKEGDGSGSLVPQKSRSKSEVKGVGGSEGEAEACCSSAFCGSHGEKKRHPPPAPAPPKPEERGSGGGSGPERRAEASSGSSRCPPRIAGVEKGHRVGRSSAAERASSSVGEGGRPVEEFFFCRGC